MASYTIAAEVAEPYGVAIEAVRAALGAQGFGILTEIDLAATLRAKLDVEVPPQVILGACRPLLAVEALNAEPSIATLLPCNVVVRAVDEVTTIVEVFDPAAMTGLSDNEALRGVAADARQRLVAALTALGPSSERYC